jgi:hypothetical protein
MLDDLQKLKILLLVCGFIGLVISAPIAYFGWSMHKGFGGVLTGMDTLIILSPFCFGLGASLFRECPYRGEKITCRCDQFMHVCMHENYIKS